MRQVVLDTETTGLDVSQGHRVIEIGCVELVHRRVTSRNYHQYLQPDREIDEGALEVHGISTEFLQDKPRFADIAEEFLAFIDGSELIIHNAAFDVGFLNAELANLYSHPLEIADRSTVTDTLKLARKLHPGQKNNLDALCKRYGVDNSSRELHGALLDARILADVYLLMTGGQAALAFAEARDDDKQGHSIMRPVTKERSPLKVIHATAEELLCHESYLNTIDDKSKSGCLWLQSIKE